MRRTLTLAAATLLTATVSGCGTERSVAGPAAEPTATSPTAASAEPTATAPIPADFPLTAGLLTGLDTELTGPSSRAPGARFADWCGGGLTWPRLADQPTDRLALRAIGPEYAEFRELVTYDSEATAAVVLSGLREAVADCPDSGGEVVTTYDPDTGTDSATFALTYETGLGGSAVQVLRVGPAVLLVLESGEFATASISDHVPDLTAQNRHLTVQLECHWGAGCPAEPVTVGPEGAGPLVLGAQPADLMQAAPAAALQLAGRGSCSSVEWTSPAGVQLRGALSSEEGLVLLEGNDGVQTADGLVVGATLAELRAAYPEAEQGDNGLWYADAGDSDYTIGVTGDVVTSLGVVADSQSCVG